MQIKKQQLKLDVEQQTGSKLEKEHIKARYCHPVYLTYLQSTACEMPGWMKPKLELRLWGGNINNLTCADDTTLAAENKKELKSFLMKVKEEREKPGLKLTIQRTNIMASGPIISRQIDGETMLTVRDFILGAPKSPQMVTTAMLAPWKKSYDKPRQHIKKQRHYFAISGPSSQGCGFSSSYVWM